MMCQFLELSCYFLAAAHKSGNLEAQRGKQSTKCSKLIAQRTLCSEKHPLFGLWKFLDPRCPGPDTTVLLAASTSVFAPTFSCPDSQSPGSLHPPKPPIYLITPGGGIQSSLAHSITHMLGNVGSWIQGELREK